MKIEDETIYKKLQDMSPFERWVWLATEKVTADSVKDQYPTNFKVVRQLETNLMVRGIKPDRPWPYR